jgi:CheY-like chemotaxis protein
MQGAKQVGGDRDLRLVRVSPTGARHEQCGAARWYTGVRLGPRPLAGLTERTCTRWTTWPAQRRAGSVNGVSFAEKSMPPPARPDRIRVLLVDDEPSIRAVYPEILGPDYDVHVAASGREALQLLVERQDFEAIVCDLAMPELDGPAFYEALRSQAPQLLDRVLFYSGGLVTVRSRDFAASIPNVFLEKPIALETLSAAIRRVAGR